MKIERLTIDNLTEVVNLENIIFKDPWPLYFFIDELNNKCAYYFVLKEDYKIVGYAGIEIMYEDGDIVNIGIEPTYQGKGFGEDLLKYVLSFGEKKGVKYFHLEVRASNIKALNLYKKLGFKVVRTRKAYYKDKEDALDMIKGIEK